MEEKTCDCEKRHWRHHARNGMGGSIYGLGFVGASIYYIQHATTFWLGVYGVIKAMVWPAIIIYKVLVLLKA